MILREFWKWLRADDYRLISFVLAVIGLICGVVGIILTLT